MTFSKCSSATLVLALPFLAGAAFAQQPMGGQQQSAPTQQPAQQPSQANSALNSADTPGPSATPNYADQAFVEDTLKNNATQVQLSQLAQQKASSGDVKDFSQRMIQIHTQLNQQFVPLAKQLQVNENQKPSKQEKKEIAQLEQLSGTDFDTAYLQAMAREQAHSLKEFKSVEKDPMLQKAAQVDEPVLTQHYQILQKIAQTHNVTLASNE